MRAWIFSDLHLTEAGSPLYLSFIKALGEPSQAGDHIVLAGDIFDVMVGNSHFYRKKFSEFFQQISRAIEKGVKLHYIEGNHDFHLRRLFNPTVDFQSEAVILVDEAHAQGKKLLYIAHGDLVDDSDHAYLGLRNLLRSKPVEILTEWIPGRLTETVGSIFSRPAQQKEKDTVPAEVRRKFRSFAERKHAEGFDYIILGHCHDFDSLPPFYYNMGYPPKHDQYLYYDSTSQLKRRAFP